MKKVDAIIPGPGESIPEMEEAWYKDFKVQNVIVSFKIDTGAQVDIIPVRFVERARIVKAKTHLIDYNGNPVEVIGSAEVKCCEVPSGRVRLIQFCVATNKHEPVLGLKSSVALGLVSRIDLINNHTTKFVQENIDCFQGMGKFPGKTTLFLKEGSVPKLHYKKRFPFAILDGLKKELNKLGEQGIITRVEYPTDWVNNIQVVEKKNGKLRLCLDPRPLN